MAVITISFIFLILNLNKIGTATKLLYSNSVDVALLNTDSGENITIASGYKYILFTDYHYSKSYIFWTDLSGGTINRIRYPSFDSETTAEVIYTNEPRHGGIVVDPYNDHLYWVHLEAGKLSRSDLDGTNAVSILTDLDYPIDLTIDLTHGWLYFTEGCNSINSKISKCKFDGSGYQSIVSDGIRCSESISLDLAEQRVYWTDSTGYIASSKTDGTDVQTFASGYRGLIGLQVVEDHIYFNEFFEGKINKLSKTSGSSAELIYTATPSASGLRVYSIKYTECTTAIEMSGQEKRSSGFTLDESVGSAFNDISLSENWHRIDSDNGDGMPTSPPGIKKCGTENPIWLNGTLPDEGTRSAVTACMQTEDDICKEALNINITNCGSFYAYFLKNTPNNSAYCFGEGLVKCPQNLSSESGFYPGCSSTFPNIVVSPHVESMLIDGPVLPSLTTPSLTPVFRCQFSISNGDAYVYDIHWYIDGNSVISHKNIGFSTIHSTDLRSSDWKEKYNMNMEVQCAVRIRSATGMVPSPFMRSPLFAAGLYPEYLEYSVVEGDSITINFQSTVPVGCFASDDDFRSGCKQDLFIYEPHHNGGPEAGSCVNNIENRDVVFKSNFCGIRLTHMDWNQTKQLQVFGYSDGMYNFQHRTTYIRLSTETSTLYTNNEIWENINIPDIKVTVIDKDHVLTNRLCQSFNDPHITTFDGKTYHFMDVGEFVMYWNGLYRVHALFTNCGYGWTGSSCHCGIAIQSRNSLFVFRTCRSCLRQGFNRLPVPETKLISCDDSDMLIEKTGHRYKVTLPTGTEIRFSAWSRFISMISIKPSIFELDKARGLCGVPSADKTQSDDFTKRSNEAVSDDQEFARSWKVKFGSSESLFVDTTTFLNRPDRGLVVDLSSPDSNNNQTRYCVCRNKATSGADYNQFYSLNCTLRESTEQCSDNSQSTDSTINSFETYSCIEQSLRRKRSLYNKHSVYRRSTDDSDDVFDSSPLEDGDSENLTDSAPLTFRNGWTNESAYQNCSDTIRGSFDTGEFDGILTTRIEDYILSCVKDIELIGSTEFISDTVNAMKTFIIVELTRNESLYNSSSLNETQNLLEYLSRSLCPNNCSGNGECSLGVCSCNEGYVDDDCSKHRSTPPLGTSLPSNNVCNLATRSCRRTNLFGEFLSETVWCKIRIFKILQGNQVVYTTGESIVKATYRNPFLISLEFASSRRKRSTSDIIIAEGYEISVSYDQVTFAEPVTLFVFDERCYTCNQTALTCSFVDTCPVSSDESSSDDKNSFVAVAATVGIAVAILLLVLAVIYFKTKSKRPKKVDVFQRKEKTNEKSLHTEYMGSRENTVTDVYLENLDTWDAFHQTPPVGYFTENAKPKFSGARLSSNF